MKRLNELFIELSWIPEYLSRRVHSLAKMSYDEQDLKQELNLKLWESLNAYFKLIKEGNKPRVDIRRYCHMACMNRKVDFIRMTMRNKRNFGEIHLSNVEKDIGKEDILLQVEVSEYEEDLTIKIDGNDILSIIEDDNHKMIFKDFIIGFSQEEIAFSYGISLQNVKNIIHKVRNKIRKSFLDEYENLFDFKTLLYIESQEDEEDHIISEVMVKPVKRKTFLSFPKSKVISRHKKFIDKKGG